MTPGNNGASTPEDDDPFGYLYEDGQARGAQPPSASYGYPNAVNRARPVGERQYGQQTQQAPQAPTAQYGQVPQQGYGQQQGGPGQQNTHYQAPESFSGGAPTTRQHGHGNGGGGGRGRGPNTKGLLIGAIAVVAAVVIGISVAMLSDDSKDTSGDNTGASTTPTAEQSKDPSPSASKSKKAEAGDLPKAEAKTLLLGGNAAIASDVPGAKSDGGFYVGNFNSVGSSVTWQVEDIPKSGKYTLYTGYGVPGKDATATLSVNGTPSTNPVDLKNWANAKEGDYAKGWTQTYNFIQLNEGTNEIKISCQEGNQCDVNLDQLWLVKGWKS
ncbi:carbohydrate-binding protein [Streptomyces europaeiscabiei]|uniref:carbohydrate-binding protein n=1 Tax=Streptomyces europaeiscabiei TaxID=146819 RepID=UPI0029B9931D|nr:carbohydrate-binding protein [Streptomyces europaeiscabiei]MDX2530163.1 carbohydrate-binding protein [Streptomyces europaeiscabiei]MDX3783039.1 carbohydrate-binding protein [Streptomyces europaeiscabiei]